MQAPSRLQVRVVLLLLPFFECTEFVKEVRVAWCL